MKNWNKGYCSYFWDTYLGIYIGDCCKGHDGNCSTFKFFQCLKKKIGNHAWYITAGGALGCWAKYPRRMFMKLWVKR